MKKPPKSYKCYDALFTYSNFSTFTWCFKHLDWAWDKSVGGTFKALQNKQLVQKKFQIHAWVKKVHFGNFSERAGMALLKVS